jgi:hypothetical protein
VYQLKTVQKQQRNEIRSNPRFFVSLPSRSKRGIRQHPLVPVADSDTSCFSLAEVLGLRTSIEFSQLMFEIRAELFLLGESASESETSFQSFKRGLGLQVQQSLTSSQGDKLCPVQPQQEPNLLTQFQRFN